LKYVELATKVASTDPLPLFIPYLCRLANESGIRSFPAAASIFTHVWSWEFGPIARGSGWAKELVIFISCQSVWLL